MRTRELFRYLVAMIIALSTTVNAMAQERALKIYFNENGDTATGPRILVKDDNGNYELPKGLKVTLGGAVWADKARFWEMFQRDVSDRVIAAYTASDKKESKLTLSFVDRYGKSTMPYEVNSIQWNVMNDLLSSSILDLLDNYRITTKCIPANGTGWSSTDEKWDMNFLVKTPTFTQKNVPWRENDVLNGLKSFEIGEQCWRKSPLGILINHQVELDDKCRTFIKAGWNGSNTNSNITDSDDSNWAFKVKFTLPDIRMRSYKCNVDNNFNVTLGQIDNNIIVGERAKHALRGYIAAHAGAVVPIEAPTNPEDIDPNDFHYEYEADKNKINIHTYTGVIYEAKVAGDIPVTVKLMRGDRLVCSYEQKIHVYSNDPTRSEIAIGFLNGNKGYDVTVGDQNAQIQGIITKYGENITLSNGTSGYHFEYSEDSHGEIIDIDPLTGKITAKKEGDVHVSAVLKNGGTIRSNTYTYSLHVFAKHEGLEFRRINTYHYSNSSNQYIDHYIFGIPSYEDRTTWNVGTTSSDQNYDWKSNNLLRINTSINGVGDTYGVNDWKQIASFSTGEFSYWRAICQEIAFDVYVPKYTKSITQYSFAGNAAIGNKKTHSTGWNNTSSGACKYGFEINYLNQTWSEGKPQNEQINLEEANTRLINRVWDTNAGSVTETFARSGASSYTSNVGAANAIIREIDNVTSPKCNENRKLTVYFAVMSYLWNNESYPGDVSIGFKGIPTYEYYSTITYYKNDGTNDVWKGDDWNGTQTFNSPSKTATMPMYNGPLNLKRDGYELLGWSTDPNATTAEYKFKGDNFCPYDAVNGGGKGPVSLYAVWRPNVYTVELKHTSTGPVDGYVYAVYDQNMPLVDVDGNTVKAPTNKGYDFGGYFAEINGTGTKYYNVDMSSNHVWDRTEENYVIARWIPHTTTVVFDLQGGILYYGATEVNATYGKDMPTEGVGVPQRQGYTFGGYYNKPNGAGTQYYTSSMTSARTWNIDERLLDPQVTEVTLYAKWIPLTYTVTLDPQGGTGGTTSVTATYGQPLPSGLTAPTKEGYEFKGYYSNANQDYAESIGQDYGGKQYYDKDMNGVEPWDKTEATTIYAHWAPKTYIVTLDAAGGVLPNPVVEDNTENFNITKESSSVMTLSIVYKTGNTHDLVHSTAKKPGYELLGWYDSNGVKVISVDEKSRNCTITDNGGYWTENGTKYNHPGDLTLTARYRQKYQTPSENVIAFDNEKVEAGEDWLWAVVNDLVGSAQEVYQKTGQQTMVFDLRKSTNMWTGNKFNRSDVMESLQKEECVSPNLLVYFNDNGDGWESKACYNAISLDNKCKDLRVTDRYSMKIPYAFNASKASYARDAQVNDAATEQASKSTWGTLCLPYPIKNNNTYKDVSKVIFYELRKHSGSVMQFYKLPEDAEIPANTPVLYERTVGISSAVTIEENAKDINNKSTWIPVPDNPNFTAVVKSYADAPEPSIHDWEFRGNLKTTVFCGKGYVNPPAGAQILDGDVYYFKQDKFTYLNPKMEKNGKTYQAAKMTLYPYRAYFYRNTGGSYSSSAKVSEYSILVIGEDGATLDITNEIFGDGEGDGKIYDLNGIRVMKPVKGRLYIVNGQKKVYK